MFADLDKVNIGIDGLFLNSMQDFTATCCVGYLRK